MSHSRRVQKTDAEWREQLTPEEYYVTREKGTEVPFSGAYYATKDAGRYACSNCGQVLFSSENKYDAGCGWPSFDAPAAEDGVETRLDASFGMERDEVVCKNCGAHLGHVFDDGPRETTGQRFCINSVALKFDPRMDEHDGKKQ